MGIVKEYSYSQVKKKIHPKLKKSTHKKIKPTSFLYIGIVVSVFVVLLSIALPDRSLVKGAATSNTAQQSSFMGTISSYLAKLLGKKTSTTKNTTATAQTVLSNAQVMALGDNTYANGNLPLGDNKYVTDSSKKGYIYLCNSSSDEKTGGAQTKGSWIHGNTWNIKEKLSVTGNVSWSQAKFYNVVSGDTRKIYGNDLPISHTTGIFPIQSSDAAYTYDKNPNTIKSQTISQSLPANPTYSATPYCMGGEVGVMLTGVALFNGFDAQYRDAAAYEVQDGCQGHPQVSGEYHYHSLSSCIKDVSEYTVIGYALDGFPITGPKVGTDAYLTTDDLDDCHGITSDIIVDGKQKTMYHYVMTQDFPYSVSCFRGKPVSLMVATGNSTTHQDGITQGGSERNISGMPSPSMRGRVPQEVITACSGQTAGTSCSFIIPSGMTLSGTCQTPLGLNELMCVPAHTSGRK